MLHANKPLPDAITHNDEIARLILVELRGLRDDLAAQPPAVELQAVADAMVDEIKTKGIPVELREPAPPPPLPENGAPLAGPSAAKGRKKAGA